MLKGKYRKYKLKVNNTYITCVFVHTVYYSSTDYQIQYSTFF